MARWLTTTQQTAKEEVLVPKWKCAQSEAIITWEPATEEGKLFIQQQL